MLKRSFALTGALAMTFILVACGGSSGPRGPRPSELPNELRGQAAGFNQTQLYTEAKRLVDEGNCVEAQPMLTCLALGAEGFDGARHLLGSCLIATDPIDKSPDQLSVIQTEGVVWIERAADAGWVEAQEDLVGLYTEGSVVPQDLSLAQKWFTLHETNPMRIALGTDEVDADIAGKLAADISAAERAQGLTLAGNWERTTWAPESPQALPDECRPQGRPDSARAGRTRPSGGPPGGRRGPRSQG